MGIGSKSQLRWKVLPDYSHPRVNTWTTGRLTRPRFEASDTLTNFIAIKQAASPRLKNAERICDEQEEVNLRVTCPTC